METPIEFDPADLALLAEPLPLGAGGLIAPNRIVYQPMEGNDADPAGGPSEVTLRKYAERARGRAGIDFFEAIAVGSDGRAREDQLLLDETTAFGFERLVRAYRSVNGLTPILFQITHSGRFAASPSAPYPIEGSGARLLTDADMERLSNEMVRATRLSVEAGADGIDFKHCHGYLCGSLLGPANVGRPGWSYGGESLEERARFTMETLARMMEVARPDRFLYAVRLSAYEGVPGGFGSRGPDSAAPDEKLSELTAFVRMLESAGVAVINVSAGIPGITTDLVRQTNAHPEGFADQQRYARAVKAAVNVPVVGSAYSYARAGDNRLPGDDPAEKTVVALGARAIRAGGADLVGIGRQSLADPEFAAKLLTGRAEEIRWDTACNRCATSLRSGVHAGCVTHDPYYRAQYDGRRTAR